MHTSQAPIDQTHTSQVVNSEHFWTENQLKVMRGLELPAWHRNEIEQTIALPTTQANCASLANAVDSVELQSRTAPAKQGAPAASVAVISTFSNTPSVNAKSLNTSNANTSTTNTPAINIPSITADCLIIVSKPLSDDALRLCKNMLSAIGKRESDYQIVPLLAENSSENDPFSSTIISVLDAIEHKLDPAQTKRILAMGTLPAQALLGVDDDYDTLAQDALEAPNTHEYSGIPLLVMQDPHTLVDTPILKAQAWRDLNR